MPKAKKMNELISIIAPIYCVEDYIHRCVDSLINQTYSNLEIILVDDGSPDNCGQICEEYAKKDHRVKVIHKKNGGISSARNAGIDICKGKYIMFIDSDDYIAPTTIEHLYKDITSTGADISICDYISFSDRVTVKNKYPKKVFTVSGDDKYRYIAPSDVYSDYGVVSIVQWNKLFKAKIFKNLRYSEGKINEDEFIITSEFSLADKISYNLAPLYHYYQREGSTIHTFSINRLDIIDAWEERIKFYTEHHLDQYLLPLAEMKIIFLIDFVGQYYNIVKKNPKDYKILKRYLKNNAHYAKQMLHQKISRKTKFKILLLLYAPSFLNYAFRLVKVKNFYMRDVDSVEK